MISYVTGDVVRSCSGRIMLITGIVSPMLYTALDTVSDKATAISSGDILIDQCVETTYAAKIREAYVERMLGHGVTVENDDYQPSCVFWNGGYCDCPVPDEADEWCSEDESIVRGENLEDDDASVS